MDVDLLKAFGQLAKSGNYRLASEQLFMTQSALTKKIQRLESSIGTTLFARGRNGAELTRAGEVLLPEALKIVDSMRLFKQLSSSVSAGTSGHLNIGFGVSTYHQAPKLIAAFKSQYPDVHIALNDTPSQQQIDALLTHELDISFNRLSNQPSLNSQLLFEDTLVVAVHKKRNITSSNLLRELADLPYLKLAQHRGPGLNKQIQAYCFDQELELNITQEADDILTLLALVSANLGVTIVPSSARQLNDDHIEFIPLLGEHTKWGVGMTWDADREHPLRDRFVQFVINTQI
ncbi:LysR family transcriptional regulator [Vibrio makurazakiensis]|uniref:LysR family transcriptional regulator n=1 Tax=Vibrio makurazakiensis TaxID=2910250 RepID=UPI003D14EFEA